MAETELVVRMVGPKEAATTVVLLHGFGAGGDDLVPLGREIGVAGVRYLFPAAPLALDPHGDSRAWWMIDVERLMTRPAERLIDEQPDGLPPARALISGLLDRLEADGAGRIVLGGFSQGAMLSLDVALHRERPLAGLALMSGTHINASAWKPRLARLRGVPIFMSHGTRDPLLPFVISRGLRDQLAAAGAELDWVEFPGGHEIPRPVLAGLTRLVSRIASAPPAAP
ncbi:MAG TPA: hypothetical protein VHE35_32520 [Kofleriaceae bacterium]|nr:hypothetical protein [Kofleriaceae bacterium]